MCVCHFEHPEARKLRSHEGGSFNEKGIDKELIETIGIGRAVLGFGSAAKGRGGSMGRGL